MIKSNPYIINGYYITFLNHIFEIFFSLLLSKVQGT